MEPLEPEIFRNGIWYKLCGEQYYPCLLPPEPENTEEDLLDLIIQQIANAQGIDEDLKERDPMAWVGAMNNIKSAAREFFREEPLMRKYDYMMALWAQFCLRESEDETSEKLNRRLRDMLPKYQRKQLLRLMDSTNAYCDAVSLESFVAGFQLAAGIARETTRSPYSFAEAEEARACKRE